MYVIYLFYKVVNKVTWQKGGGRWGSGGIKEGGEDRKEFDWSPIK